MRILGLVPARYASSRFPGKPLHLIAGKPLLQHVVERCRQARLLTDVIVATDDDRIRAVARQFARVEMTSADHPSGTDRIAEVVRRVKCDAAVNIQGDEPLIDPAAIDIAITTLLDDPGCGMATLKKRISTQGEIDNPNVVKVVTAFDGRALYFSRSAIPFNRGGAAVYWKHIGLYVYRRELLLGYSSLRPGALEETEKLEQLRALENGIPIRVAETTYETIGVDTPEDLQSVLSLFQDSSIPSLASSTAKHG
jgi:3-deoxy-manno-octulosonate cytidylyltransferase (CMP-KDO synthetase)